MSQGVGMDGAGGERALQARRGLLGRPGVWMLVALGMTAGGPAPTLMAGGRTSHRIGPPVHSKVTRYPTLGAPDAPLAIWVFADLQCPFSRRLVRQVFPRLVRAYPGKVRVVFRHFPLRFHREARPAALAVEEVFAQRGSQAAWKLIALIYDHYRQIDEAHLVAWSAQVGADGGKVREAVRSSRHAARINADIAMGRKMGVRGTPSSFLFRGPDPSRGLPTRSVGIRGSQSYQKVEHRVRLLLGP